MTQLNRRRLRGAIALVGGSLAVVAIARTRWSPVRVEGDSMEPTLPEGTLVAVSAPKRVPAFGTVVVVRRPDGSEHLKRIVGTRGDRYRLNGVEYIVEPDHFAVAGDNRSASTDSRHYGAVRREDVVAIARVAYWPPASWRLLPG